MYINELFEAQEPSSILVIYPGRFQPWHKGHKAVYDHLIRLFGRDHVFIATSNKVDPPRSPFNFSEKIQFMQLTGVSMDRVVETRDPYRALEIVQNYNPKTTRLILAVSEKDMAEDPRFKFGYKKDGSPTYMQAMPKNPTDMQPFEQHGYVMTVPTFEFTVLGKPMSSATEVRRQFANADNETQKNIVTDLFGRYSPEVHSLMKHKIIMSESTRTLAEDAEPMDREYHLVKKLGRLGERIVQTPKLWDKYSEALYNDNPDWIVSLIQEGTGATFNEVLHLSDLFGEIGGGLGRIVDFAWAVKEGTWEEDFLNPYRNYRSRGVEEGDENPYRRPSSGEVARISQQTQAKLKPARSQFIWRKPNQIGGSFTDQQLMAKGFKKSQFNSWGGTQAMWDTLMTRESTLNQLTPTAQDILQKHQISPEELIAQLKLGVKIEFEHTKDAKVAYEIALDHLNERPDYYTVLARTGLEESSLNEFAPSGNSASSYYAVTANFVNEFAQQKQEELQDLIDSGWTKQDLAQAGIQQGHESDIAHFEQVRDSFLKGLKPGFDAYLQGDTQLKDQLGAYWIDNDLPLNQDWEKIYGEPWGRDEYNEDAAGVGVIAQNKKMARDPRYSMSMTKDVKPGQVKKNLQAWHLIKK